MTLAYERATGPGWGTLVVGERRLPFRLVAIVLGTAIWLGAMLLKTGGHGVDALWTNLVFLAGLLLLASLTQSLTLRRVSTMFFAGGLMMGLMLVVSAAFGWVEPDPNAVSRALVLPPLEEVLKLAPVLFFVWRRRHGRLWALGATDLLLLAAASGAGFALVEDAYIRARFGWPDQLAWLPVTEILRDRLIAGHAVWTALAGATLGLGLLLRSRGRWALAVAVSGFALATLDHVANNLDANTSGFVVGALNLLLANGFLVAYLFVVAVAAVVAADLYVLRRTPPRFPSCPPPPRAPGLSGMLKAWEFRLNKRALTYATFQYRRATGRGRGQAGRTAALLARSLQKRHVIGPQAPDADHPAAGGAGASSPPRAEPLRGAPAPDSPAVAEMALEPTAPLLSRLTANGPLLWLTLLAVSGVLAVLQVVDVLGGLFGGGGLHDVGRNVDPTGGPASTGSAPGAANGDDEEEEDDDCATQERWLLECQSRVDTYQQQLDNHVKQLEAMQQKADALVAELTAMADGAQSEVAWHLIQSLISKLLALVTSKYGGPLGKAYGTTTDPLGALPGVGDAKAAIEFFTEMQGYFDLMQGDIEAVAELAEEHGLAETKRFVEKMRELQDIGSKGRQIGYQIDEINVQKDQWQEKLDKAREELDKCRSSKAA
ncbi:MAG TPA: PrsW family glutamic-type intramembrane protease [Acidimicrobiia bacterium]|nr:PrsW family glutamic-type intramembrane protease [Acidimicrobiia bacterium]